MGVKPILRLEATLSAIHFCQSSHIHVGFVINMHFRIFPQHTLREHLRSCYRNPSSRFHVVLQTKPKPKPKQQPTLSVYSNRASYLSMSCSIMNVRFINYDIFHTHDSPLCSWKNGRKERKDEGRKEGRKHIQKEEFVFIALSNQQAI